MYTARCSAYFRDASAPGNTSISVTVVCSLSLDVEESKEDEKMIINLEEVAMSVPMVPHHWKSSRHRF